MTGMSDAERCLAALQVQARRTAEAGAKSVMSQVVPEDLATLDRSWHYLDRRQKHALDTAHAALLADLRFEHLERDLDECLWRFVVRCAFEPSSEDYASEFYAEHVRVPIDTFLCFPVESLTVEHEIHIGDATFLPLSHADLPQPRAPGRHGRGTTGFVVVPISGTHYGRMTERARDAAEHALRTLRVSLAGLGFPPPRLWFRLGSTYTWPDGTTGWRLPVDTSYEMTLDGELALKLNGESALSIPAVPTTDVERKAKLALEWVNAATLATDPVIAMLFLCFAIETLLGRKDEKRKGRSLAYRRALLSLASDDAFTHPNRMYFLYGRIRSEAVHGEHVQDVAWSDVRQISWDVRKALTEYLSFARANRLTRRATLLKRLEQHPDAGRLIDWLRAHGGTAWGDFDPHDR